MNMLIGGLTACALGSLAAAGEVQAADLLLRCPGTASVRETQSANVSLMGSNGGMATGQAQARVDVDKAETLFVEIKGTAGRVRLPKVLQPLIGAKPDGWWDLAGYAETPGEYSGQVRFSPINRAKVVVDRRLGVVELNGFFGSFRGTCTKEEVSAEPKF